MMKKPLSFPLSPHYEASSTGTSTSSSASSSTTPSTCPSPLSISPSHDTTSIGYAALSAARVAATVASFTGLALVTRDSVSSTTSSCMEERLGDGSSKGREIVGRMSGSSDSLGETMSTSYEESSHKKVLVMRSRVVAGATPVTAVTTSTCTVGVKSMMSASKPSMGFAEMMRENEEDAQDMNDDGDFGFGFIDFDD